MPFLGWFWGNFCNLKGILHSDVRCPRDWIAFGNNCYLLSQDKAIWEEAKTSCEDNYEVEVPQLFHQVWQDACLMSLVVALVSHSRSKCIKLKFKVDLIVNRVWSELYESGSNLPQVVTDWIYIYRVEGWPPLIIKKSRHSLTIWWGGNTWPTSGWEEDDAVPRPAASGSGSTPHSGPSVRDGTN